MQNKIYRCSNCGSDEFVTSPNKYEVYNIVNEQLELVSTELADDDFKLFCRCCSNEKELNNLFTTRNKIV